MDRFPMWHPIMKIKWVSGWDPQSTYKTIMRPVTFGRSPLIYSGLVIIGSRFGLVPPFGEAGFRFVPHVASFPR